MNCHPSFNSLYNLARVDERSKRAIKTKKLKAKRCQTIARHAVEEQKNKLTYKFQPLFSQRQQRRRSKGNRESEASGHIPTSSLASNDNNRFSRGLRQTCRNGAQHQEHARVQRKLCLRITEILAEDAASPPGLTARHVYLAE